MYLLMDKVVKEAFGTKIGLPNNIEGLKSSSKFLSREINLKKIELGGFNIKLGLKTL